MARRRSTDHPENHERWLISYADFITLMFAFFVVMFAASQADRSKAQRVSEAVQRALEDGKVGAKLAAILGGSPAQKGGGNAVAHALRDKQPAASPKMVELTPSLNVLTAELQDDIKKGRLKIEMEPRGLVISLKEASLFNSGDDYVLPSAYGMIEKVASTIRKIPNPVRLEGHTDSQPIKNSRFRNNWQLSAARSLAMLELLISRYDVPPARLALVGYGETVPLADNETEDGRSRNRRVDITILNEITALQEAQRPAAGR